VTPHHRSGMMLSSVSKLRGLKIIPVKGLSALYHHVVPDALVKENGGLLEYSVVYTDRALNHMSEPFKGVMTGLHASLCAAYNTDHCILVPGSGSAGMEAAARAFAGSDEDPVVVIRNGYFSYRWSEIFDCLGNEKVVVCKAGPLGGAWKKGSALAPPLIDEVVETIRTTAPRLICAPHVETSTGIILPNDYIRRVAAAAQEVGAVFVLDGIAAGGEWADMRALGVDCYLTAPQKGWSGPASSGVVLLNSKAMQVAKQQDAKIKSFALNLNKWSSVMEAYLGGGHAYHATMPTDALRGFYKTVRETEDAGLEDMRQATWALGKGVRKVLQERGFESVAAPGFDAPGVVVVYSDSAINYPAEFASTGLQIAAGVPPKLGEPEDFSTFRIGLFGIDKLLDVDRTISCFTTALDSVISQNISTKAA